MELLNMYTKKKKFYETYYSHLTEEQYVFLK